MHRASCGDERVSDKLWIELCSNQTDFYGEMKELVEYQERQTC